MMRQDSIQHGQLDIEGSVNKILYVSWKYSRRQNYNFLGQTAASKNIYINHLTRLSAQENFSKIIF